MEGEEYRNRRRGWVAVAVAAAVFAAGRLASGAGVGHFETWAYQWSWYPLLLAGEGLLAAGTGRFALLARPRFAASLFFWSIPVWFFFELLNLRLGNWFYVGVPNPRAVRWLGYGLAFATVLPAIWLPFRALERVGLARELGGPAIGIGPGVRRILGAAGVLFLALPLWRPDLFFPLVWGGAALLLAPWNHRRDPEGSLLGRVAAGRYGRLVRLLAAGLAAGLAWEGLNWISGGRWIYTVPGLEELKLFEMPLVGFLGFPAFAVECDVIYRWLAGSGLAVPARGGRLRRRRAAVGAALALAFSAGVAAGVDRWTVASRQASVEELPGVDGVTAGRLRAAGLEEPEALARADSVVLSRSTGVDAREAGRWIRAARLAELRGLGAHGARALWDGGIRGVCPLARSPESGVRALLEPTGVLGPPSARGRRVRVWLRAARDGCSSAGAGHARGWPRAPVRAWSAGRYRIFELEHEGGEPPWTKS